MSPTLPQTVENSMTGLPLSYSPILPLSSCYCHDSPIVPSDCGRVVGSAGQSGAAVARNSLIGEGASLLTARLATTDVLRLATLPTTIPFATTTPTTPSPANTALDDNSSELWIGVRAIVSAPCQLSVPASVTPAIRLLCTRSPYLLCSFYHPSLVRRAICANDRNAPPIPPYMFHP